MSESAFLYAIAMWLTRCFKKYSRWIKVAWQIRKGRGVSLV